MHKLKTTKTYRIIISVAMVMALVLVGIACYMAFSPAESTVGDATLIFILAAAVIMIYVVPQLLFFESAATDDKYIYLRRSGFRPQTLIFRRSDVKFSTAEIKKRLFGTMYTLKFFLNDGTQLKSAGFFVSEKDWKEFEQLLPSYYIQRRAANLRPKYQKEECDYEDSQSTAMLLFGIALVVAAVWLYYQTGA